MRRLYLLRHAKSSWDDPSLDDHERPLAARGKRASKLMRRYVEDEGVAPSLVLCSTATRAQQTLEGVQAGLPWNVEVRSSDRLYTFSREGLLRVIHGIDERVESAMVVGHNPAMQDLTLELAGEGEGLVDVARKFPTCTLATLDFGCPWCELAPGVAALAGFVRPKYLKEKA